MSLCVLCITIHHFLVICAFFTQPFTYILVMESVYRVFTFGQEHQHTIIILLPWIQLPRYLLPTLSVLIQSPYTTSLSLKLPPQPMTTVETNEDSEHLQSLNVVTQPELYDHSLRRHHYVLQYSKVRDLVAVLLCNKY